MLTIQFYTKKKGINNVAADPLSRRPVSSLMAISMCTPTWIEKLKAGYDDDAFTKQLITELSLSPSNDKGFQLVNGVIRLKGGAWVGNNLLAQQHILQALHDSGIGGHLGFNATY